MNNASGSQRNGMDGSKQCINANFNLDADVLSELF
jgi:hypothetical protein